MDWKPNKWIACILGFFLQPLGMLYVVRLKWAFIYFGINAFIAAFEYVGLYKLNLLWLEYFSFNFILMIVCAVHAYRISTHWEPVTVKPWYSHWYGLTLIPITIFIGLFSFRAFLYEPFKMRAGSMLPTIKVDSVLVTKKMGFGNYGTFGITLFKKDVTAVIRRGDIIVFEYPEKPSINFVKRVIGLPGDKLEYKNKKLTINGKQVTVKKLSETEIHVMWQEQFKSNTYSIINHKLQPSHDFKITIPEEQYFVLGDNRDNSRDSRYWGFLPKENLVGKAIHVFD